jgi:hypothetical protein
MRRLLLTCLLLLTAPLFAQSPLTKQLPVWWLEAEDAAAKVPVQERKPRERAIVDNPAPRDAEKAIRSMLMAIALRPQDARGAEYLTGAAPFFRAQDGIVSAAKHDEDEQAAITFLVDLYARHSGTASAEQVEWQSGQTELLLALGRWKEALPLQREVVARTDDTYKKVLLGVVERLNGNGEPLAKLLADCPDDPKSECDEIARSIVNRMAVRLDEGTPLPQAAKDILAGRATETLAPWEERMHGLTSLSARLGHAADDELRAVLAAPDAPEYVKDDAVLLLAMAAVNDEGPAFGSLMECWFARRHAVFPPVTADSWEQLRELMNVQPEKVPEHFQTECYQHDAKEAVPFDRGLPCVGLLLESELDWATEQKNEAAARQIVERAVGISLARKRALPNLSNFFLVYAMRFPNARARQYVGSLNYPWEGVTPWSEEVREAARQQTQRVLSPWDSPSKALVLPAADCVR